MNYQLRIKETTNEIKELEKSLYPIENQLWHTLSDGVVKVSRFLPAYWYIRIVDMLSGGVKYSAGGLAQAFAMQLLFIAALSALILAVRKSRVRS